MELEGGRDMFTETLRCPRRKIDLDKVRLEGEFYFHHTSERMGRCERH